MTPRDEVVDIAKKMMVLAEKATLGQWTRSGVRSRLGNESCITVGPDGNPVAWLPIGSNQNDRYHAESFADAGYIAFANPENVRKLCEAVLGRETGWISVEERLPTRETYVIICYTSATHRRQLAYVNEAMLNEDGEWVWGSPIDDDGTIVEQVGAVVTHWRPLPHPPAQSQEAGDGVEEDGQ